MALEQHLGTGESPIWFSATITAHLGLIFQHSSIESEHEF